jgi:hypothetical protein
LERGIAVRQGQRFLRAELPRILATPNPDVLSPRSFPRGTSLKNQGKTGNRDISNKNREADEARAENH